MARTVAFFLAKPLQLAGISVASGIATWRSGKGSMFEKFAAIKWAIFSNPKGFKWSRNSDSMRLGGVDFLFLKKQKSRKDLLVFNPLHNLLKEGIPLIMAKTWTRYSWLVLNFLLRPWVLNLRSGNRKLISSSGICGEICSNFGSMSNRCLVLIFHPFWAEYYHKLGSY